MPELSREQRARAIVARNSDQMESKLRNTLGEKYLVPLSELRN